MNEDQVKQLVAAMVVPEALRSQPEPAAPVKDAGTRVAEEEVRLVTVAQGKVLRLSGYLISLNDPETIFHGVRRNLAARVNAAITEAVAAEREQRKAEAAPAQPQPEPAKGRTPGEVFAQTYISEADGSGSDEIYIGDYRVRSLGGASRSQTIAALRSRLAALIYHHRAESAKAMRERCAKWLEQVAYTTTWAREVRNLPLE